MSGGPGRDRIHAHAVSPLNRDASFLNATAAILLMLFGAYTPHRVGINAHPTKIGTESAVK
jgi:hypothetical protein